MLTKEFGKHDWDCYSGAEAWNSASPLIADGEFDDGTEYQVIFDATGASLISGVDEEDSDIWVLELPFPCQKAAATFAAGIGTPGGIEDFEDLGFYPAN